MSNTFIIADYVETPRSFSSFHNVKCRDRFQLTRNVATKVLGTNFKNSTNFFDVVEIRHDDAGVPVSVKLYCMGVATSITIPWNMPDAVLQRLNC